MSCVVVGGGEEGWRRRRRRKGMGEQGEMEEEKKKALRQSFLTARWRSVWVCVFFSNFIQFGRGRRSAWANNSLQTADVITF